MLAALTPSCMEGIDFPGLCDDHINILCRKLLKEESGVQAQGGGVE